MGQTIARRLIRTLHLAEKSIPKFRIGHRGDATDRHRLVRCWQCAPKVRISRVSCARCNSVSAEAKRVAGVHNGGALLENNGINAVDLIRCRFRVTTAP
jgi:hypothetical protein